MKIREMSKHLLWVLFFTVSCTMAPSEDPSVGIHGMALMKVGDELIASHMPLHRSKHAHQIVLSIRAQTPVQQQQVLAALNEAELVSLLPNRFSLSALRAGELKKFKAVVYLGHFERRGAPALDDVEFEVEKILLDKHLSSQNNGSFYNVPLDGSDGLLIHRIGRLPSFDQIVLVSGMAANEMPTLLQREQATPLSANKSEMWLSKTKLVWGKQLYLEEADFAVRP